VEALERGQTLQPLRHAAQATVREHYSLGEGERRFRALLS
jgi:hypothetical protein